MTGQGNKKKTARGRGAIREPLQTPCVKCPLRKLDCFCDVTSDELDFVQWMKSGELVSEQGTTVLMEGHSSPHLYTILSGWAFRFKSLPDGRRQILNFALPGDFLGLQTSMFNEMQHSVETLTNTVMCVFPRDKIWTLYKKFPSLAYDLTWIASRSERLLDEQLLAVGRRSALERIAFVLQHLALRAQILGLGNGNNIALPITQQHLADALGLSLVHTNKTLKILNDRKIVRWKEGSFAILDEKAMRSLSGLEADPLLRPLI